MDRYEAQNLIYIPSQKQWIENYDVKVGDAVKPVRLYARNEYGFIPRSVPAMDVSLNKELFITGICSKPDRICGVVLTDGFIWPWFVLEKIDHPKIEKKDILSSTAYEFPGVTSRNIEYYDHGVRIGALLYDFEELDEFFESYQQHKKEIGQ